MRGQRNDVTNISYHVQMGTFVLLSARGDTCVQCTLFPRPTSSTTKKVPRFHKYPPPRAPRLRREGEERKVLLNGDTVSKMGDGGSVGGQRQCYRPSGH